MEPDPDATCTSFSLAYFFPFRDIFSIGVKSHKTRVSLANGEECEVSW